MVITFKKRSLSHQNSHTRAHHAAMAFSAVAFVNGLGVEIRGECAMKWIRKSHTKSEAFRYQTSQELTLDVEVIYLEQVL